MGNELHAFNPELYRTEHSWQEGDLTVTRSVQWSAPGCHDGCHVLLYTDKDGKLVKVEGDPNAPYNKGRLCMRCLALPEVVNHPDRIKYPMKRVGKRGENKWERISWDEALDTITNKAKELQAKYGPHTIVVASCTGRNAFHLSPSLAWASFGSTHGNVAFFPGDSCYLPRMTSMAVICGGPLIADCGQFREASFEDAEWKAPDYMIIWGNNPLKSNADGFYGHWVVDLMKQGTKLITIDPECNWLAARSEYHIQLRPGTDGAIAMAMLNVIIAEDLFDHDYVDRWCYGFDELAASVAEMTPERAGEIAGVDPEVIAAAARAFANSEVASVQWGLAVDTHTHGSATAMAIVDLSAICGFIDVPGGNVFPTAGYIAGDVERAFMSIAPDCVKDRTEGNWDNIPGFRDYPFRRSDLVPSSDATLEELETDKPNKLSMLYMTNSNTIANTAAEAPRVYKALQKFEFIVVADCFMTPSMLALADIALPIAMGTERNSVRDWWAPIGCISKASTFYEAKSDEEIILEIGRRMRPEAFPWDDEVQMWDWLLSQRESSPRKDHTFAELQEKNYEYEDFQYRKFEKGLLREDGQPGFNTPTGRLELYSLIYKHSNLSPLPYYAEPVESPVRTPSLMKEFPYVLTTGKRSYEFFHSEHRQVKALRQFHQDPRVFINTADAEREGIADGAWVWIENIHGKCKMRAVVTDGMKEGVVSAEHGWWFPERDPEDGTLFGVWESNINNCTTQGDVGPSGYGTSYKTQICKIYEVTPENDTLERTPEQIERANNCIQYARSYHVRYGVTPEDDLYGSVPVAQINEKEA